MKPDQTPRIVLIEDNPGDVLLLRHTLDMQGVPYQLEVLNDGEQALGFIRTCCPGESSPDVLILDLYLPKHDGLEVLKALRQKRALSQVSVVALTGTTNALDKEQIRSLGVSLYREKPANIEGLRKLGEEIIALCEDMREPA
jgi:CheY-like chemotaxis protein